jgi:hypothetical protein
MGERDDPSAGRRLLFVELSVKIHVSARWDSRRSVRSFPCFSVSRGIAHARSLGGSRASFPRFDLRRRDAKLGFTAESGGA